MQDQQETEAAEVARRFLRHLEAMDIEAAVSCFAADGIQEMPFAPAGFPQRLDGINDIMRQYGGLPNAYHDMKFTIEAVHPFADPEKVLLQYRGSITQRDGGRYDNLYAGLFHVRAGHILLFQEYFNPIVLQQAFAGEKLRSTFTLNE